MRFFLLLILLSSRLVAQQNFFNVPSSDITPQSKIFFQEQLNVSNSAIQSSSTWCYGLGKHTEIGFNIIGLNYQYQKGILIENNVKPYSPYFSLNLQKLIPIKHWMKLSFGGQTGITPKAKLGYYFYSNLGFLIHETHTKLIAGTYLNNTNYFGEVDAQMAPAIALQLGIEQAIIKDKLVFQADYLSGRHSMGDAVYGFAYFFNSNWVLSAGYQVPNFQSSSVKAMVVEITYIPK